MPKAQRKQRDGATAPSPYSKSRPASKNPIFKMNKDLGQHILKNPGIAQAIVDKAGLRQSDVSASQPERALASWTSSLIRT